MGKSGLWGWVLWFVPIALAVPIGLFVNHYSPRFESWLAQRSRPTAERRDKRLREQRELAAQAVTAPVAFGLYAARRAAFMASSFVMSFATFTGAGIVLALSPLDTTAPRLIYLVLLAMSGVLFWDGWRTSEQLRRLRATVASVTDTPPGRREPDSMAAG